MEVKERQSRLYSLLRTRGKPRVHLFHFEVPLFRSYQLNHQSRFYTGLIIFKVFAEEKVRAIS